MSLLNVSIAANMVSYITSDEVKETWVFWLAAQGFLYCLSPPFILQACFYLWELKMEPILENYGDVTSLHFPQGKKFDKLFKYPLFSTKTYSMLFYL